MTIAIARISDAPLDAAAHLAAVEQPWVGAVTSFIGTVRAQDPEAAGPVVALEYSAHPDAEATLHDIAMSAIGDRPVTHGVEAALQQQLSGSRDEARPPALSLGSGRRRHGPHAAKRFHCTVGFRESRPRDHTRWAYCALR